MGLYDLLAAACAVAALMQRRLRLRAAIAPVLLPLSRSLSDARRSAAYTFLVVHSIPLLGACLPLLCAQQGAVLITTHLSWPCFF